jgi:hypothetical protein
MWLIIEPPEPASLPHLIENGIADTKLLASDDASVVLSDDSLVESASDVRLICIFGYGDEKTSIRGTLI